MRLSEAIRFGALLKRQGFHRIVNPRGTRTCALGAALDAVGALTRRRGRRHAFFYADVQRRWPLLEVEVPHPLGGQWRTVYGSITALNDDYRWTREQIADWVATIEDAAPVSVEAEAVLATVEGR